jgi:hypothetical protein
LVVNGKVFYNHGGFDGELRVGQTLQYKKHGVYTPEYIGDSYALIHHVAPNGTTRKVFIPPQLRANISRGDWHFFRVNYGSFQESPRYA